MNIHYHPNFVKHFKNRIIPDTKLKKKFETRLNILLTDPNNPILYNHKLTGILKGLSAISITGDIRLLYRYISTDDIQLYDIGSHNQVYR